MKKLFLVTLTLICALSFTACDNKKEKKVNLETPYMILVNKQNKLPGDWESRIELVDTKNVWDEDIKIEKKTFKKYKELKAALEKEGIYIELDSVYRSVAEQQKIWDDWTVEKGLEYVQKYVAVPGTSEHHTGLAVDICIRKDGELVYENEDMMAEKEIFNKIHKRLAEFGFILRYPEGKEDITGYGAEVWHFRYINSPEIAKEIMDKGLTFEEWYAANK